jgi:hypothetical protein
VRQGRNARLVVTQVVRANFIDEEKGMNNFAGTS